MPAVSPRASSPPPPSNNDQTDRHDGLGVVSRWGLRVRLGSAGIFQLMEDDRHDAARSRS